jgi:phosphoesterase RecJ-like protein
VQDVEAAFDLVIALDCSDLKRLGHFTDMPAFGSVPLLNIDHHVTNLNFGDVNLVDPRAASATEIVLRLLEYMAVPLDAELATCLLTGIVTDTRGFRTSNVTIQVMDAALRLPGRRFSTSPTISSIGVLQLRSACGGRHWPSCTSLMA